MLTGRRLRLFEVGLDRGVVGEAQRQPVALGSSRRSAGQRLGRLERPRGRGRAGGRSRPARSSPARPKRSRSSAKTSGFSAGPQVEVAAEQQRRLAGPLGRRPPAAAGRPRRRGRACRWSRAGWRRRGSERGAGERHRPPLRPALVDRQLAPLDDPAERAPGRPRPGSGSSRPRRRRSGRGSGAAASPRSGASELREVRTRWRLGAAGARPAASAKRGGHSCSSATSHSPAGEHRRELGDRGRG